MPEETEDRYIRPIVNASYPGTLAALSMTVFGIIDIRGTPALSVRVALLLGAISFLLSSFSIFFYTVYPTRTKLWTSTALMFLVGLVSSLAAAILLVVLPGSSE